MIFKWTFYRHFFKSICQINGWNPTVYASMMQTKCHAQKYQTALISKKNNNKTKNIFKCSFIVYMPHALILHYIQKHVQIKSKMYEEIKYNLL